MPVKEPSADERRRVEAEVRAEEPQIAAALEKIFELFDGLTLIGQKQVLTRATATWVAAVDPERAYELSEQMRVQTDVYLDAVFGEWKKRPGGH